jgi:hypothetical protein
MSKTDDDPRLKRREKELERMRRKHEDHMRSYEEQWKRRAKAEREAMENEMSKKDRREKTAQQQREAAAAKAADSKRPPLPPPVRIDPTLVRRKEMLLRMGSPPDNPTEIKKAWKRLALQYHPDKCGGADTQFKSILEAYEYLMK